MLEGSTGLNRSLGYDQSSCRYFYESEYIKLVAAARVLARRDAPAAPTLSLSRSYRGPRLEYGKSHRNY